jgi:hypothetical protein
MQEGMFYRACRLLYTQQSMRRPARPRQSNRPFIRAGHDVTGHTFSPALYRRQLNAYAPERRPSTRTLSIEKVFVDQELANANLTPVELSASPSGAPASIPEPPVGADDITLLVREAVDALNCHPGAASDRWAGEQRMAQAHIAAMGARLAASERALSETYAQTSRLAADLLLALETAARYRAQLDAAEGAAQARGEAHTLALHQIAVELDEIRKFAMRFIDDVRGERRAERERRIRAEDLLKTNQKTSELFRQMAY